MVADDQKNNDFFSYLADNDQQLIKPAKNQKQTNQLAGDQVIFKDQSGKMKVLKNGQVFDFDQPSSNSQNINTGKKVEPIDIDQSAIQIFNQLDSNHQEIDADSKNKIINIIKSRLKGVRNNIQTRAVLADSKENGGLGWADKSVDQLLYRINQFLEQNDNQIAPVNLDHQQSAQVELNPNNTKPSEASKISVKSKLVSPIDELAELTLKDFRALASDPAKAAENILNKIKILGLNSFAQLMAGIKAWRQSPLNELYLALGKKSLTDSKSIDDLIDNHDSNLTRAEFDVISDLNQKLIRYV
ncbi:MAG: hypothetical protein JW816_02865 [Candidatus Buchananbacteria bacterium]|nr:hypothetical protein [Candidatus Buchananbacteria bacterium]